MAPGEPEIGRADHGGQRQDASQQGAGPPLAPARRPGLSAGTASPPAWRTVRVGVWSGGALAGPVRGALAGGGGGALAGRKDLQPDGVRGVAGCGRKNATLVITRKTWAVALRRRITSRVGSA